MYTFASRPGWSGKAPQHREHGKGNLGPAGMASGRTRRAPPAQRCSSPWELREVRAGLRTAGGSNQHSEVALDTRVLFQARGEPGASRGREGQCCAPRGGVWVSGRQGCPASGQNMLDAEAPPLSLVPPSSVAGWDAGHLLAADQPPGRDMAGGEGVLGESSALGV